jgi:hypothetical protein
MSALVEKKTGFDGKRTLIQEGLCAWCNAGSIFAQDIVDQISDRRLEKQTNATISELNIGRWMLSVERFLISSFFNDSL